MKHPPSEFPRILAQKRSAPHLAVLRRISESDAVGILDAFASPDMARQGNVADLDAAREYARAHAENPYARAIEVEGRLVGLVAISADGVNRLGWFYYWMSAPCRGQGLTSCAAATLANWALSSGGLERLELGHRVSNPASGAVARAAGFIHEGTERAKFLIDGERIDVLTYGRLASDPVPRTPELPWR